jgi:hypothetical protein
MKHHRNVITGGLVVVVMLAALLLAVAGGPRAGQAEEEQPILTYPDYPPTPTIGPNPTSAPALSAGATLASTDFSNPATLADWQIVELQGYLPETASVWAIRDGALVQDYTAAAANPSIQPTAALFGDPAWADYSVRVAFYDQFNGTAGLIARYQDPNPPTATTTAPSASFYRFRMIKDDFEASPKQVLEKVVDGVATSLVEIKAPGFSERAWHTLELRVVGGDLQVWFDGTLVAEASDPDPLPAGRPGVYTRAVGGMIFDDFVVMAP